MKNIPLPFIPITAMLTFSCHAQSVSTISPNPGNIYQDSLLAMDDIDKEKYEKLWRQASHITQESVDEKNFALQVHKNRTPMGEVKIRNWIKITRIITKEKISDIQPGNYISIYFTTHFTKSVAIEMITYRQDEDGVWRFSGYLVSPEK